MKICSFRPSSFPVQAVSKHIFYSIHMRTICKINSWGQFTKDIEGEFDHEAYWGSGPIFATCEGGAFDVSSEAGEVAIDDHDDDHGEW